MSPAHAAANSGADAADFAQVIRVRGARENNLTGIDIDIPKRKLVVFTGVSGSGKSSLAFDTIAAESQRLINETYPAFLQSQMPTLPRPDVDSLENLNAAIVVDQERIGANSRSTVGTATDTWTMLRIVFARVGAPTVASPSALSFNDPAGMCQECGGVGRTSTIDVEGIFDRSRSLNEGAIVFPNFAVGSVFWKIYSESGFFDNDKPLAQFTADEWEQLLTGTADEVVKTGGYNMAYEGVLDKIKRLYLSKEVETLRPHVRRAVEAIGVIGPCDACGGSRLNEAARACRIDGVSIADCNAMQITELSRWATTLPEGGIAPLKAGLCSILANLVEIGLGYLSLDRAAGTLSGGEAQRIKMVRHLDSSLTEMTYVFDEPTAGLHAHDTAQMIGLLERLRDKGNTVLVVEHNPDVIAAADHVVDIGPRAGRGGGRVVYQGDVAGLRKSGTSTGDHLAVRQPVKADVREPVGTLDIKSANLHNLRDVSVGIPLQVLTAVTGVAGAGKSSLIIGSLPKGAEVAVVDQSPIKGSRRSNPATYTGMLDAIREAFAAANRVKASLFSANSDGACPVCKGLGVTYTDLGYMTAVPTTCEKCEGRRFTDEVLSYRLRGSNIADVLAMSIDAAADFFTEKPVLSVLTTLQDVGLGYVSLGQPLTTLSGGERQRLRLAIEMRKNVSTYVLDEPSTGLHLADVDNLVRLLDGLVDRGASVIVIEHNLDIIARADWVVDLGPGAGDEGGRIVYEGPPAGLPTAGESVTGRFLHASRS
ncbi:ATP-binding cassette domain-containing protein [Streptomyces sp. NPDC020412]|uniref:ATP-binding cassette domain-containing protein n=1 Tax=Streptomyces sp. NPDC020412 TaxID=3365073 RepID=UPI0037B3906A